MGKSWQQVTRYQSLACKAVTGTGLANDPSEAIAWFNLGIGLHQRRIAAAVRAYRQCLALPHGIEVQQAAHNNLAQDLLLLGCWQEDGHYAQRLSVNRETIRFLNALWTSHRGPVDANRPVLLMSEQGFGDTLQFSRYALYLQRKRVRCDLAMPASTRTPAAR